jgi:polysaccharide export outer membrane protein
MNPKLSRTDFPSPSTTLLALQWGSLLMSNISQTKSRIILAYLLSISTAMSAQNQGMFTYNRTRAIDQSQSQAERVAEDTVALSAEKIIPLLQRETGLLLEFKKLLVRKAFEQGRILDGRDLNDDALFRLIRDDETIRVLATREIERRYYVRAMPSKEELERDQLMSANAQALMRANAAGESSEGPRGTSREDVYWQGRARMEGAQQQQQQLQQFPPSNQPGPQPAPRQEAPPPDQDTRSVLRAQSRGADVDSLNSESGDAFQMPRVRPEDLPELLRASSVNGLPGGSLNGLGGSSGDGSSAARMLSSMGSSPASSGGILGQLSLPDYQDDGGSALNQRASLDVRDRLKLPPNYNSASSRPDRPALRRRVNPYADVPSLYDLYAQYGGRSPALRRFGQDVFENGTGNFDELPMDMPVGPDYVLGPGDGLNVELWGGISQRLRRVVDREGRVALPEVGFLQVSGKNLGDVQKMVQSALREQFRDVEADISLSRLRTVRVYVVGDVDKPGAYDISALSTPLNAVFSAGGPTSRGSLRVVRHYRGNQLVQEVDVYDLLLHGVRTGLEHLQAGDTVLVPPLGPEVTLEGMVRRPAIYEIRGEKNLAELLQLAGGVVTSGTLRHVDVERVQSHESRTMLRLDIPESNNQEAITKKLEEFLVQDGDKVKISPILPYADKTVYLDGHVFRPGKYAYRDGMKVADLISSYSDLLPEPAKQHAEIIRLVPPVYTPQVLAFNLGDALDKKADGVALQPFDTVRIFSRFDFEDPPVVTISGEVRDPGDHLTNGVTRVRDAVYLAGGLTSNALVDTVQILRRTSDNSLHVLSVNLGHALAGDDKENILLEPKDQLIIHRNLAKVDPPTVRIEGQVARPGKYPLSEEMTAAALVQVAGGFKRGAYTETADLTRYDIENGQNIVGEHSTVEIAAALMGKPDTDVRLRGGDVLTIKQIGGWRDIGATITLTGEVLHPGTYGIDDGERLSSVLERAGGLRDSAYPYGAVFEREQVREIAERSRANLVRRVEDEGATLKLISDSDSDQKLAKGAALMQWQTTMEQLQSTPPTGRMVIHISKDMKKWKNTAADIQVRGGDSLHIPKVPNSVTVDGAVYNATAVSYRPGRDAGWYLQQAGGPTNMGNKKGTFVIRADGSVVGGSGGLFSGGVEDVELRPGDMVVVPDKPFSVSTRWRNILQGAQLAYAVGIAIQVARSF